MIFKCSRILNYSQKLQYCKHVMHSVMLCLFNLYYHVNHHTFSFSIRESIAHRHVLFVFICFRRPNVMKQKNAFPPNFIHSLDSSHMMLTSLFCEREGITFVSVHDCFWTHPSSVDIMNKV